MLEFPVCVLPSYHQPHLELIHSLQNKLLSCLLRDVAQSRTALERQQQDRLVQAAALRRHQTASAQPGDAASEVARFGDGPWASCVGSIFPRQQSTLKEPENNRCQFQHVPLNTTLAFDET